MQNEQTLIDLGFRKISSGEYLFFGANQIFLADIHEEGGRAFVVLKCASPEIDNRPYSDNKGKRYRRYIKHCCSNNSVRNAIAKYDLPETHLTFTIGGVIVSPKNNSLT